MKKIGKLLTALMVALTLNIGGVFAQEGEQPNWKDFDWSAFNSFLDKGVIPGDKIDIAGYYKGNSKDLAVTPSIEEDTDYIDVSGTVVTFKKTGRLQLVVFVGVRPRNSDTINIQSKTKTEELKNFLANGVTEGDSVDLSKYFLGRNDEFTVKLDQTSSQFATVKGHIVVFNKAGNVKIGVDIVKAVLTDDPPEEPIKEHYDVIVKAKDNGGTTPPGKPGGHPIPNQPNKDPKYQPQAQKTNNKGTKSKVVKTSDNTSIIAYSVAGLFSIVVAVATKKRLSANK